LCRIACKSARPTGGAVAEGAEEGADDGGALGEEVVPGAANPED